MFLTARRKKESAFTMPTTAAEVKRFFAKESDISRRSAVVYQFIFRGAPATLLMLAESANNLYMIPEFVKLEDEIRSVVTWKNAAERYADTDIWVLRNLELWKSLISHRERKQTDSEAWLPLERAVAIAAVFGISSAMANVAIKILRHAVKVRRAHAFEMACVFARSRPFGILPRREWNDWANHIAAGITADWHTDDIDMLQRIEKGEFSVLIKDTSFPRTV